MPNIIVSASPVIANSCIRLPECHVEQNASVQPGTRDARLDDSPARPEGQPRNWSNAAPANRSSAAAIGGEPVPIPFANADIISLIAEHLNPVDRCALMHSNAAKRRSMQMTYSCRIQPDLMKHWRHIMAPPANPQDADQKTKVAESMKVLLEHLDGIPNTNKVHVSEVVVRQLATDDCLRLEHITKLHDALPAIFREDMSAAAAAVVGLLAYGFEEIPSEKRIHSLQQIAQILPHFLLSKHDGLRETQELNYLSQTNALAIRRLATIQEGTEPERNNIAALLTRTARLVQSRHLSNSWKQFLNEPGDIKQDDWKNLVNQTLEMVDMIQDPTTEVELSGHVIDNLVRVPGPDQAHTLDRLTKLLTPLKDRSLRGTAQRLDQISRVSRPTQ